MSTKNKNFSKIKQIRHGLIYLLPMPLNFFLPFISIPIFTRILTPKDYGLLAMAMIYASFINGFVNLGITLSF